MTLDERTQPPTPGGTPPPFTSGLRRLPKLDTREDIRRFLARLLRLTVRGIVPLNALRVYVYCLSEMARMAPEFPAEDELDPYPDFARDQAECMSKGTALDERKQLTP